MGKTYVMLWSTMHHSIYVVGEREVNQQEECIQCYNVFNCIVKHLPAIGNTLILADFVDLSARDIVIFLCVNESVECGLK